MWLLKNMKIKTKYFITNDVDINPKLKTIQEYFLPYISNCNTIRGILTSPCDTLGGLIKNIIKKYT